MSILQKIKSLLASAEAWLEEEFQKAEPWLKSFFNEVEHDIVTSLLPFVETAGAQIGLELVSGQPIAAIGTALADLTIQTAKNMEAAGVHAAAHDLSAAVTGYVANLKATGVVATGAQTATQEQADAAAKPAGT